MNVSSGFQRLYGSAVGGNSPAHRSPSRPTAARRSASHNHSRRGSSTTSPSGHLLLTSAPNKSRNTSPGTSVLSPTPLRRANTPNASSANTSSHTHQQVRVADVSPTHTIEGVVRCIEIVGDGVAWTAEADGSIRIRALPKGNIVRTLEGKEGTYCTCLLYLHALKKVWAAFSDGFIRVLDAETAFVEREFVQHDGSIYAMIELEGKVFSGGADWKVYQWEPSTCQYERLFYGHANGVRCFSSYDGPTGAVLFSGSDDGTIKAWDPYCPLQTSDDRACMHTFTGHTLSVLAIELVFHRTQLWSASEDTTLRVWDLETLGCVATLRYHQAPVCTLAAIETRVWSGDKVGCLVLWDVKTLAPLTELSEQMRVTHKMVLCIKKLIPSTMWKVWTTGSSGVIQCWNAECIPIVFEMSNAGTTASQQARNVRDALRTAESDVERLSGELRLTQLELNEVRDGTRLRMLEDQESLQVLQEENELLRRRLAEQNGTNGGRGAVKTATPGNDAAFLDLNVLDSLRSSRDRDRQRGRSRTGQRESSSQGRGVSREQIEATDTVNGGDDGSSVDQQQQQQAAQTERDSIPGSASHRGSREADADRIATLEQQLENHKEHVARLLDELAECDAANAHHQETLRENLELSSQVADLSHQIDSLQADHAPREPVSPSEYVTSQHSRKFPGKEWTHLMAEKPEEFKEVFACDVSAALNLPTWAVSDVLLRVLEGEADASVSHHPQLTQDEIDDTLRSYPFGRVAGLLARRHKPKRGLDAANETIKRMEGELDVKKKQIQERDEELTSLEEQLRECEEALEHLRNRDAGNTAHGTRGALNQQETIDKLEGELAEADDEIGRLQLQVQSLEADLVAYQDAKHRGSTSEPTESWQYNESEDAETPRPSRMSDSVEIAQRGKNRHDSLPIDSTPKTARSEELEKQIASLQRDLDESSKTSAALQERIRELEETKKHATELEASVEGMRYYNEDMENQQRALQGELEAAKEEVLNLQRQLEAAVTENKRLSQSLGSKERERETSLGELRAAEQQSASLAAQLENKERLLSALQSQVEQLKIDATSKNALLDKYVEDSERHLHDIADLKEKHFVASADLDASQRSAAKRAKLLEEANEELERLRASVITTVGENRTVADTLRQQLSAAQEEVHALEQVRQDLGQRFSASKRELAERNVDLEKLKKHVEELEANQKQQLRDALEEAQASAAGAQLEIEEASRNQLIETQQELADANATVAQLTATEEQLRAELEDVRSQNHASEAHRSSTEKVQRDTQAQLKDATEELERLRASVITTVGENRTVADTLRQQLSAAQEEVHALEQVRQDLGQRFSASKRELAERNVDLEKLKKHVEGIESKAAHQKTLESLEEVQAREKTLSAEAESTRNQLVETQQELADANATVAQLTATEEQLRAELEDVRSQNHASEAHRSSTEKVQRDTQAQLKDATEELERLRASVITTVGENRTVADTLRQQLSAAQEEVHALEQVRQDLGQRFSASKRELAERNVDLEKLKKRVEELEASLDGAKYYNEEMETQLQQLRDALEEAQASAAGAQLEIEEASRNQLTETQQELADANATVAQLTATEEQLRAELEDVRSQNHASEAHRSSAEKVQRDTQAQLKDATEELERLRASVITTVGENRTVADTLRQQLSAAQEEVHALEQVRQDLGQRFSASKRELAERNVDLEKLKKHVEELEASLDGAKYYNEEMETQQQQLESKLMHASEESESLRSQLSVEQRTSANLQKELDSAKLEIAELSRKWDVSVEQAQRASMDAQQTSDALGAQLAGAQEELIALQATAEQSKQQMRKLQAELKDSNAQLEGLQGDLEQLHNERDELKMTNVEQSERLKTVAFDNTALNEKIASMKGMVDRLQQQISECEREKGEANEALTACAAELEAATVDVGTQERAGQAIHDELERLRIVHHDTALQLASSEEDLLRAHDELENAAKVRDDLERDMKRVAQRAVDAESGLSEMREKLDATEDALAQACQRYEESERMMAKCEAQMERAESRVKDLEAREDELVAAMASTELKLKDAIRERDDSLATAERSQLDVQKKTQQKHDEEDARRAVEESAARLAEECEAAQSDLRSALRKLKTVEREFDTSKQDLLEAEQRREALNVALKEEKLHVEKLEKELAEKNREIQSASRGKSECEEDLQSTRKQLDTLRDERDALQATQAAGEKENSRLAADLAGVQEDLREAKKNSDNLQEELQIVLQSREELEATLVDLEELLANEKNQHDQLVARLAALTHEFERTASKLESAEHDEDTLRGQLNAAREQIEEVERKYKAMRTDYEDAMKRCRIAEENEAHAKAESTKLMEDAKAMSAAVVACEDRMDVLRSQLRDTKSQMDSARGDARSNASEVDQLRKALEEARRERNAARAQLDGLNRTLKSATITIAGAVGHGDAVVEAADWAMRDLDNEFRRIQDACSSSAVEAREREDRNRQQLLDYQRQVEIAQSRVGSLEFELREHGTRHTREATLKEQTLVKLNEELRTARRKLTDFIHQEPFHDDLVVQNLALSVRLADTEAVVLDLRASLEELLRARQDLEVECDKLRSTIELSKPGADDRQLLSRVVELERVAREHAALTEENKALRDARTQTELQLRRVHDEKQQLSGRLAAADRRAKSQSQNPQSESTQSEFSPQPRPHSTRSTAPQ